MVSARRRGGVSPQLRHVLSVVGILLLSFTVILGVCPAPATAEGTEEDSYDVQETFTITVDELGNARYTDVLKYDPEFFNTEGFDFDKYPNVLTRRYRQKMSIDSIQEFTHSIDRAKSTITLRFKQAGRAYNHGDHWVMYGFSRKPVGGAGVTRVFERKSTVNSELTLGRSLTFKTKTVVRLPATATAVRWDEKDGALLYEVPYAMAMAPGGNVLQENRVVFVPVFVVLMLASAAVVIGVLLRRSAQTTAEPAPAFAAGPERVGAGVLASQAPSYYVPPATETQATVAINPEAPVSGEAPAASAPAAPRPPAVSSASEPAVTSAAASVAPGLGAQRAEEHTASGDGSAISAARAPDAPPARPAVPVALEGGPAVSAPVVNAGASPQEPAPPEPAPPEPAPPPDTRACEARPVARFCRFCGAGLPASSCRFCPSCGQRLSD